MTKTKQTAPRTDVYAAITASVVRQLEQGVRPWHQPWQNQHAAGGISRPLRHTGQPYRGINVIVLWLTAYERGYTAPLWVTFQQAKELGGSVKKGEKGTTVVYANAFEKTKNDPATGEDRVERIPFMRSYTVFNAEQTEGLPPHFYARIESARSQAERIDAAEAFFKHTGAETRHGGNRAFYSPGEDYIQMPPFESFESPEAYYGTRAHETCHWTKAEKRLDRSFNQKRFGDDGYAMEELVAELGSAFLAADLGLTPEMMPEHASYLSAWLKILKADSKALFTAAAHAERAAEYLHDLQPSEPEEATNEEPTPTTDEQPKSVEATSCYRALREAMERSDMTTAREYALSLKERIERGGNHPTGETKAAVEAYLKTALLRTIYPD